MGAAVMLPSSGYTVCLMRCCDICLLGCKHAHLLHVGIQGCWLQTQQEDRGGPHRCSDSCPSYTRQLCHSQKFGPQGLLHCMCKHVVKVISLSYTNAQVILVLVTHACTSMQGLKKLHIKIAAQPQKPLDLLAELEDVLALPNMEQDWSKIRARSSCCTSYSTCISFSTCSCS